MIWLILGAIVVVAGVAVIALRRRPSDSGPESFRRHIDALSPQARREVIDRVNRQAAADNAPIKRPGRDPGTTSGDQPDGP